MALDASQKEAHTMTTSYQNATSQERETIAAARKPGEEVPKCAAFFNSGAECDLFRSHHCAPSQISIELAKLFAKVA